ncbi:PhzA/PhzB family protein [Pseudomonas sp. FEN]|uniref:PhzA/PhzB family protein n=1 Tax=Pseudomonas sp. FEN TaxID=2767468 RepID=UPI0039900B05
MQTKGPARLRRHELFYRKDGSGRPVDQRHRHANCHSGKDKLAEHAVWSLKCFPDWEWYDIRISETDDPNHFWVRVRRNGRSSFRLPGRLLRKHIPWPSPRPRSGSVIGSRCGCHTFPIAGSTSSDQTRVLGELVPCANRQVACRCRWSTGRRLPSFR